MLSHIKKYFKIYIVGAVTFVVVVIGAVLTSIKTQKSDGGYVAVHSSEQTLSTTNNLNAQVIIDIADTTFKGSGMAPLVARNNMVIRFSNCSFDDVQNSTATLFKVDGGEMIIHNMTISDLESSGIVVDGGGTLTLLGNTVIIGSGNCISVINGHLNLGLPEEAFKSEGAVYTEKDQFSGYISDNTN